MKLYVLDIERTEKDTLYTFLERVLKCQSQWSHGQVNATYIDSNFTKIHCEENKKRSFDDLLLISKTYFRVSDKTVAKTIFKIIDDYPKFLFILCRTANKWILNYGMYSSDIEYCGQYNESYKKLDDKAGGKHSFNDILKLANK